MAGDEASAIHSRAFPPNARLHRPSEFAVVLASPLRSRAGCFELRYCLTETGRPRRLGLVIPKRLARQAVLRNRIKRVAREAFRHQAPELAGIDIVVRLVAPIVLQSPASDRMQMRLWRRQVDGLLASISPRQTP